MTEWISVKDRLPEMYEDVLWFLPGTTTFKDKIFVAHFCNIRKKDNQPTLMLLKGSGFHLSVTHWMPLPKPPEQ
jgi:hypothetical protein